LFDPGELGVSPDQHGAIVRIAPTHRYPRRETASAVLSGDHTGGLR
jgi:hypothetical protein